MKKTLISTLVASALVVGCSDNSGEKAAPATPETKAQTTETAPQPAATPAPETAAANPLDQNTALAKKAIKDFATQLQGELKAAMKEGGPVNALQVCNTKAMDITKKASADHSMTLGRVSLKNRNPGNAATGWTLDVAERFEVRKESGVAVSDLVYREIVDTADGQEFRMMKAIPAGEVCMACHGTKIAEPVAAKLKELYPEDKATGFSVGDIRGAFVVTKKL
ncbi:MAG: c-type heme family protein [bacterium]